MRNVGSQVLRVLGLFSSSTLLATFDEPITPGGPQLMLVGAPANVVPRRGRIDLMSARTELLGL